MKYLKLYKHLLPRGRAWSLIADKPLRRFFLGLALVWEDVEQYLGEIYFDLFVGSTRALDEWDDQFGFTQKIGTDSRLARLSAAWKASGGQSPRYIQDTLQAAGFDVYVHEWWEPEFLPGTAIEYTGTNYVPSPFDPDSWSAADPDGSVTSITLDNPSGADVLGECVITSGNLTFITTVSSFNSIAGDKIYCCFIVKNVDASNVFVRFQSDAGTDNQTQISLATLTKVTGDSTVLVTSLSDGFSLVQVERTTTTDLTNADVLVYANGDGGTFYVQAAYFGKANDWPATIVSPLPNPNHTPPPNLTPRNPLLLLADDSQDVVYYVEAGEPLAQAGEPLAQAGQAITPVGFPLVNKVTKVLTAGVEAGEPLAQAGEPLAQAGEIFGYRFRPRTYDLPTDPALWPYFLYIGGEKFGTTASVDTTRRAEFERLCLKICPLQLWLGMLVTYE